MWIVETMSRKDVTDAMVVAAYAERIRLRAGPPIDGATTVPYAYEILMERTGLSFKECYRACERALDHGLIEYGVSLRCGWLTDKGNELLRDAAIKEAGAKMLERQSGMLER